MTKLFPQRADSFRHRKPPTSAGNHPASDGDDVIIRTSGGRRFSANSKILASNSPVLERLLADPVNDGKSEKIIRILGVPYDGVTAFVGLLQAGCDSLGEETMKKYGMHLLVLSHVYQVKWLKRACEVVLAASLNAEVVVDVLKLARLCDAPWLGLRCMKLVQKDFDGVQMSDAWRFLEDNDPWLELYILQFLHEEDTWEKERKREKEEKKTYLELSEAMECLEHIFKEGCTDIKPAAERHREKSCPSSTACHPLQVLLLHFSKCGGDRTTCVRCRRIWQLLKLHSAVCLARDSPTCKVPLCRQFRYRMQKLEGKLDEKKWMILGKKVASMMAFSSLTKRKKKSESGLGFQLEEEDHNEVFLLKEDINAKKI